jgi:hypothetical protein
LSGKAKYIEHLESNKQKLQEAKDAFSKFMRALKEATQVRCLGARVEKLQSPPKENDKVGGRWWFYIKPGGGWQWSETNVHGGYKRRFCADNVL